MKKENINFVQISKLLKCQLRTVSNKVKGITEAGFSVDEAILIKKKFFPSYDFVFLFERTKCSD